MPGSRIKPGMKTKHFLGTPPPDDTNPNIPSATAGRPTQTAMPTDQTVGRGADSGGFKSEYAWIPDQARNEDKALPRHAAPRRYEPEHPVGHGGPTYTNRHAHRPNRRPGRRLRRIQVRICLDPGSSPE